MEEKDLYSYLPYFNFSAPPFSLVPDSAFFFPAKSHLESIEVLSFALHQGNLISVLTGEPGLGKTQVLLTLLSRLPEDIKQIHIINPALCPSEFLATIFQELNLSPSERELNKDEILKKLKTLIIHHQNPFKRILLVIDEAQLLPIETLEELRLLTNLNEGGNLFLQIFLIGQPGLADKLRLPQLSPLRQRISIWEILRPFTKEEIFPYLWFRIKQVSQAPDVVLEKKIEKHLYKWTKGIPRIINKLMDRTLFIAYVRREKIIKKGHLKEAKRTFTEGLLSS